jgi:hypothetical protein
MTRWMRVLHKWIGVLVGIQFVLWMGSGLVMSLLDANKVHGASSRTKASAAQAWPAQALPVDAILGAAGGTEVTTVATGWLGERAVYRVGGGGGVALVDALDGTRVGIDAALAARLSAASYAGNAAAGMPRLLEAAPEVRGHEGPVWRIDFADDDDTSVYVSARTGDILAHRNSTWRVFDVAWMLHIMDYDQRTDFNHPLVIASALAALLLTLGGIWLTVVTFRLPGVGRR